MLKHNSDDLKTVCFLYFGVSIRIHAEKVRYENRTFGQIRGPGRGSVREYGQKRKKLINNNLRADEPRTCVSAPFVCADCYAKAII